MEIEHSNSSRSSGRKRRKTASDPGLLGDLVASRFFQVLIGKTSPFGPAPAKTRKREKTNKKQSIAAIGIDLVIFAILVVLAPPFTLFKFISSSLGQYWWCMFVLGIATGCTALFAFYYLLAWLL